MNYETMTSSISLRRLELLILFVIACFNIAIVGVVWCGSIIISTGSIVVRLCTSNNGSEGCCQSCSEVGVVILLVGFDGRYEGVIEVVVEVWCIGDVAEMVEVVFDIG